MTNSSVQKLEALLRQRLHIISDHALRAASPQIHLDELRKNSGAIDAAYHELKPELEPRLRHYMEQASYSKALDHIENTR